MPHLLLEHPKSLPGLPLRERFADADDGMQTSLQGRGYLFPYGLVRVPKILPPLLMANNDIRATNVHQHGRRDLAGVGTGVLPEEVLSR